MTPSPGKPKAHITPDGVKKLQAELDRLWNVERPKVTQEVAVAAAHGDRSENAEYIYGKKRLREIDRRLAFLRRRFDQLVVVQPGEVADPEKVFFGAWVTLEDEEGTESRYRLVGPDEIDPEQGLISIHSPLGRALVGKAEGDEVTVKRPAGVAVYEVVRISYEP